MTASIPVLWATLHPETAARGYWDQGILEELFAGRLGRLPGGATFEHWLPTGAVELALTVTTLTYGRQGAVVVVPGRMNAGREDELGEILAGLPWCVLIVTSDEEHLFDPKVVARRLDPDRSAVWWQTPPPSRCGEDWFRILPLGYRAGTPARGREVRPPGRWADRWLGALFAGQVTHARREQAVAALDGKSGALVLGTSLFGSGVPHDAYLRLLGSSRWAPCPSGPVCHETFRTWEALEMGAIPLLDGRIPDGELADGSTYWRAVLGEEGWAVLGDVVDDWRALVVNSGILYAVSSDDRWRAAWVDAWWQWRKRALVRDLFDDIGQTRPADALADRVTVLMPTSPIESHPSTLILDQTVASIEERLPGVEIFLLIDGIRAEQQNYSQRYLDYVETVLEWCRHRPNITPMLFPRHSHQVEMTRRALAEVRTPTVLFVEHDTPLDGDLPVAQILDSIEGCPIDLVRLHHETEIPSEHDYLMAGHAVLDSGLPVMTTRQWSQRPHFASTRWYRDRLAESFPSGYVGMIEDRLHGVVQSEPWERWRLGIYHPDGPIKRSGHLDGRGSDEKWPVG